MGAKALQEEPKPEWISLAGLQGKRGWTKSGVARFLGPPDKTCPNPRYKSAAPMKLYGLDRVKQVEVSAEYSEWCRASEVRRERAQKVVVKRRAATLAEVEAWRPDVGSAPLSEVRGEAIAHYNHRQLDRYWEDAHEPASTQSDPLFLERIMVNYLRHAVSDYDDILDGLIARVGKADAYRVVRERVLGEIAKAYPRLAQETKRQLQRSRD